MNTHSCIYCVDSVEDLVKAANSLASIITRGQGPAHPQSPPPGFGAAFQVLQDINTCVAIRHLAQFPRAGLGNIP